MTSAIPQEERKYIKAQSDKDLQSAWQEAEVPDSSKPSDQLNVPSYKHLAWSCPLQPPHSQGGEDMWLWVMPAPQILLPSLSHSSVIFSEATAESLHTSDTEMSHTIKKNSKSTLLTCF